MLTMTKLCDDTEVSFGLKGVQHLNDVLMPQPSQDLDLLPQISDVLLALAMLHDELHGCDLTCKFAPALVHLHVSHW